MLYEQIAPPPSLTNYVKYFWIGEAPASQHHLFIHHATAASSAKLVFHYQGGFHEKSASGEIRKSFSSGIQGQSKIHTQFISSQSIGILGVEFYPYAIPLLFSLPATELTNQYIDLKTFFGNKGEVLEESIFLAQSTGQRVSILTQFLESLIKPAKKTHIIDAVQQLNKSKGNINLELFARQLPFSQRQFERLFKELVGFSPKSYLRILKFEKALPLIYSVDSFTSLALDAGYYDQAHFNHDFKEFTGLHPKDYLKATINQEGLYA
ncbi:AraC family transcriptional regulator [Emticicia sp. C21]|uniref:helix-turn-helix domain-containing protein n=1 Tax=Emticicia sp. C21 TaxID=2302915 RepID=UPI000E342559|nr:helix-turn-helix domain-containing protein [Emticicia sp. C21]RFS14376.1 AraC family transcriptional regulator [Emticicia sp. C21]